MTLTRQKKLAEHIATAKTKEAVNDYIEENSNDMGAVIKAKLEIIKDGLAKAKPVDKREFFGFTDVWFSGANDNGLKFWIGYDCLDRALLFSQRSSVMLSIN